MRGAPAKSRQPHLRQGAAHAAGDLRLGQAQLLRAKRHVLRGERAKQLVVGVLKNQANLAADFFKILLADSFSHDLHRSAAVRFFRQDAIQVEQQGGFARAVRAEQSHAFAGPQREG